MEVIITLLFFLGCFYIFKKIIKNIVSIVFKGLLLFLFSIMFKESFVTICIIYFIARYGCKSLLSDIINIINCIRVSEYEYDFGKYEKTVEILFECNCMFMVLIGYLGIILQLTGDYNLLNLSVFSFKIAVVLFTCRMIKKVMYMYLKKESISYEIE